MEIAIEDHKIVITKKLEKMFRHIDYKNSPELCPDIQIKCSVNA